MLDNMNSTLLTWSELASQEAEKTDTTLNYMRTEVPKAMNALSRRELMAAEFAGLDETLARGIVLRAPKAYTPGMAAVMAFLPRALGELTRILNKDRPRYALKLASYVNAVRCCGGPLPNEAVDMEARWIEQLARKSAELDETSLRTAAFAAVAVDQLQLVPTFTGGKSLPTRFEPGQTFGPNFQGFVRYLATAKQVSAAADDIEPAWDSFLALFPAKLSAGTTCWADLIWCARAVMVGFEGEPVGVVGRLLHERVS